MAEPVRYSDTITLRCQPEVSALLHQAAHRRGSKPSEYVRQALRLALQRDGLDPAQVGSAEPNASPEPPQSHREAI